MLGPELRHVRAVGRAVLLRSGADALRERRDVVGRGIERHPQRHALGVHEVVGAGRADLDELGRGLRRDELERLRRLVDAQQLRALRRGRAADRGQQLHQRRVARRVVERDAGRAAEALRAHACAR